MLFEGLADQPWSVFLDSGMPIGRQGRYDILAADPYITVTTRGERTEVRRRDQSFLSPEDPFEILRRELSIDESLNADLPFCGGAIGYFGYDLARRLERMRSIAHESPKLPEMLVGIYDWALIVDHRCQRSCLIAQNRDPRTQHRLDGLRSMFVNPRSGHVRKTFRVIGDIQSNMNRDDYRRRFEKIKQYIRDGDCYQVNFAQRFNTRIDGDPWCAYRALRKLNPAPFGAYFNTPAVQVLSNSPECFLRVQRGAVTTKPIKGTRPRANDPVQDRTLAEELCASVKDQAENLMIVDLLRNDLGKNCRIGSIRVPALFELQSFANVHHLVSTVTGELKPDHDSLHLLRGCFPGGSVTGAPKMRAMEIIEELEPHRRGVYCGTVGYVGFDGDMNTNIAIRTMVHLSGNVYFHAGGGIVSDSTEESEYNECYDKAASIMELLRQVQVGHVGS